MKNMFGGPVALAFMWAENARLMAQAQTVIALRMMAMAGFWRQGPGEDTRMITEKQRAFADAGFAMWRAAMRGGDMASSLRAGMRPLDRTTSANIRRLGRLGPALPKAPRTGGRRKRS